MRITTLDEEGVGIVALGQEHAASGDAFCSEMLCELLGGLLAAAVGIDIEGEKDSARAVAQLLKLESGWGYDRIVGAMANLGHRLSDQTVGNILRRHDTPPAPKRKQTTSWKDFIRAHMAVLVATDFFTVEVLTLRGLIMYYVLFFIHLESRRICLAGVTRHPNQEWMEQMARNVTMEDSGFLIHRNYLLHDHDSKYGSSFRLGDRSREREDPCLAVPKSESERLCGTLGKVG